ncbi:MAG: mechanosensitive ion channel [Opitutales bacterium]|nr:mechanosensitive ion channel [Opitutales bacterium]
MSVFLSPFLAVDEGSWCVRIWGGYLNPWWESFRQVFVGPDLLIQLGGIAAAFLIAWIVAMGLSPLFRKVTDAIEERDDWIEDTVDWGSDNFFRILVFVLLWSISMYLDASSVSGGMNYILVRAVASIATLWLVSAALPAAIKKQVYFKTLFFVLAIVLVLNLLGVWVVIRDGLDGMKLFPVSGSSGETKVTVLSLFKGIIAISILIPMTGWLIRTSTSRVGRMPNVSPALQVLATKFLKVFIAVGAILFVIGSLGVNLSAFAFMGGAIGLGLGFGFQKVISNLISGVILLGDRSIKPGDVIEVDQTYGWINTLGARYTSVITRDGTEHLIPNEMMITEKVVNWSFSDDKVRVKIPFGVSYTSDIHKAMDLALEAAGADKRILADPPAAVRLTGYGDNSVDFELRAWILDPTDGLGNIRSAFYIRIWDLFKSNDIEFPYPQRDLHIKDMPPLDVRVAKGE